ncbi:MAG: molybdopterin-dependent oxidoreductase [Deltaproteobacteria bacterium]|nr:molybdopterin-dependent oxidoreductase [Deltaproteobacteria bacterium]
MEVMTTCTLDCPDRCSILCSPGERGLRLRGNPDHPYTRGFTCAKIRRYPGRLKSVHRIREPWIRTGDHFRSISWEAALDEVCEALSKARAEPGSTLLLRGAGSMGVSKAYADQVFGLLGARRTRGSLCDSAGIAALEADAGALDMNDPAQLDRADAIVLWGKNPLASSIHTAAQVVSARKRRCRVLAVTPDASAVRTLAERVIRVRPGTDRFLALAVSKLLLDRGGVVPWERAANRAEFERLLEQNPLADLLDASGTTPEEAQALADLYGRSPRTATIVGWGVQRHSRGGENLRAVHALAFLAGTLGVPGGGLYYNIPSSRHLPRPPVPPPAAPPLSLPALARELPAAKPPVSFLWISCSNFLNAGPDAKAGREAFEKIPTVVAVDAFWTETARRARVVLPAALWLEEEDVVGSYWYNGIGAVRRVVEPPEGCRTDFEIVRELAWRLGVPSPYERVDDWLAACLPEGRPGLEALRERGFALRPWPPVAWSDRFAHPDGRFRFLDRVSPERKGGEGRPFTLLTLIRTEALHSQWLPEEQKGSLPVRMHPERAAALGLEQDTPVRVVSAAGELEAVLHLDPNLHPEAVACPRGGWVSLGLGVNEATEIALTDLGGGAAYYSTHVRVERAG